MDRFLCLHGHFYQPPRENPWLNAVEREPSAHPDHDWNSRIARECYVPNGAARIVNPRGEIVDLVNNYAWLSFDVGPTLLTWLEAAHPAAYARLVEADRQSFRRLDGHGNAIAHPYSHVILPLANERDLRTLIRWGLADFRHRFGREPEAMWLPEAAVNEAVLRALIDHRMKFVVLSPHQALRCRPIGKRDWHDAGSGSIDPRRPYRWFDRIGPSRGQGARHIDVFFYDGGLSHAFSFERILTHSKDAADRLERAFEGAAGAGPAPLVHAATDGETFGHHHPFAEMGLAHLFERELPSRGLSVVNYGYYLDRHAPTWEVELKAGEQDLGTAWSCGHGLGRWMEDCGCGAPKGQGRWRKPLRDALDFLRDAMTALLEEHGGALLKDVWAARDAYVGVMLDRGDESLERFLGSHLKAEHSQHARETVLRLMEMQKNCLYMFTSCGWFFSDVSGLEAVQNLRYAARAVELARRVSGVDLEPDFIQRLRLAPAGNPDCADGGSVYEKLVRPSIVTHDHVAARYAVSLLFNETPRSQDCHYRVRPGGMARHSAGGMRLLAGRASFHSGITHKRWERAFLVVALPDQTVHAYVSGDSFSDADYELLLRRLPSVTGADLLDGLAALRRPLFPGRAFTLADLRPDERAEILSMILEGKLAALGAMHDELIDEYLPLAERFASLGLEVPGLIMKELELALCQWMGRRIRALRNGGAVAAMMGGACVPGLEDLRLLAVRARKVGLALACAEADADWASLAAAAAEHLERRFSPEGVAAFRRLVEAGAEAGFQGWKEAAGARFLQILRRVKYGRGLGIAQGEIVAAARLLGIDGDALGERLASGARGTESAAA